MQSASVVKCRLSHLEQRCASRGLSLDEAKACIVSESDGFIFVDTGHPAYPAKPSPSVSLPQKVSNFAASAIKHVAAGMPLATENQVAERFAICQGCEHFDGKACKKCGCPVIREQRFISKLSWAGESCPVGKWGPVS